MFDCNHATNGAQCFIFISLSPENNACFTVTVQPLVAPMAPTTNMM
jgi:hypothetical protein